MEVVILLCIGNQVEGKERRIGGEFKLSCCGVDRTGLFKDCFGGEERVNRTKDIEYGATRQKKRGREDSSI